MQQIVRRRPAPRPLAGREGPLPSYLLFGTALGVEARDATEPEAVRRPGRRRTSVLMFLERVLWPN